MEDGTVDVKTSSGGPKKISDRMARELVINVQTNPHITAGKAAKSSKHRFSCSQDNNTTYIKQHTWPSCQKEQPQHKMKIKIKIRYLKYAKEHVEKPEAFWNYVLWTDKTKLSLSGHRQRSHV